MRQNIEKPEGLQKSSKPGKSGRGLMHEEVGKAAKKSKAGNFDCTDFCGCTIEADEEILA